jgi:hypothetical protein
MKVFAVYLNDASCSCTQAELDKGKAFLRDNIASSSDSSGSYFFETNTNNLVSTFDLINQRTQQFIECKQDQFPGSCGATCDTAVNGGTCKPIVCPTITPTPTPTATPTPGGQTECVPIKIDGALATTDIQADQLNKKVVSATRILQKAFPKNKKVLAFIKKARADAKNAYVKTWGDIFGLLPATVYSCPSGCTGQQTVFSAKATIFSGINSQLEVILRATREIKKRIKSKSTTSQATRLEREGRNISANMRRLLNDVPDGGYRNACS